MSIQDAGNRVTRRRMLGGTAAAIGATAVARAVPAAAEDRRRDGVRIDVHRHMWPPAWRDYRDRQGGWQAIGLTQLPEWTVEDHFAFDDRWGFAASAVSLVPPACAFGDVADRRATARAVNEYGAGLLADHGARFAVLGTSSLPDVEGARAELRHLLDELRLDGFGVSTNYFGTYIGDPAFAPIYEELNARDAVVFVHPFNSTYPPPGVGFSPTRPFAHPSIEWTFETTRAIANLIHMRVVRDYPRIRWIFAHTGGAIFSVAFRLSTAHAIVPAFNEVLPEGADRYLERMYFDTAQAFGPGQLLAAREYVPVEHLLLGTDASPLVNLYADDNAEIVPLPPDQLPRGNDPAPGLRLAFGKRDRALIEGRNALALFPRLAAALEATSP
jgi:6-methylsalicylate decarboxylase